MNNQVMIDRERELFEADYGQPCHNQNIYYVEGLNCYGCELMEDQASADHKSVAWYYWQRRAALQSTAPKGVEPTVIGTVRQDNDMLWGVDGDPAAWRSLGDGADLMTIAQHRAIVAGLWIQDGVSFGFDNRSVVVSQEAYSIFLEREAAIRDGSSGNDWIACSERLPDVHKAEYLCLFDDGSQKVTEWHEDEADGWGFWYGEPTHWMPLPPSPKEG